MSHSGAGGLLLHSRASARPRPKSVSRPKSRHAWKSVGLHLAQRLTHERRASRSATGGTTGAGHARAPSSACIAVGCHAASGTQTVQRACVQAARLPVPFTAHAGRHYHCASRPLATTEHRRHCDAGRPLAGVPATPTLRLHAVEGAGPAFPPMSVGLAACADLSRNASPGKPASLAAAAGSRAVHSLRAVTSQRSTTIPSNSVCSTLLQSDNNAQWAVGSPSECAATSPRATGRRSSYAAARGSMAPPHALEPAGVLGSGWRGVVAAAHDPYHRGTTSLAKPAPRRPALPVAVQDVRVPDDEGGDAHPHAGPGCSRQDDGAVQDAPRRGGDHHPDDR